jgi:hypothetical protein
VALRVPGTNIQDVIQVHRRYLVELMQQWTRIKEEEAESDMGLALVVDAELFRLDAVIRWLDAADGRIKRAGADAQAAKSTDNAQNPNPRTPGAMPSVRRRVGVRK